jgi:hypothetical protein
MVRTEHDAALTKAEQTRHHVGRHRVGTQPVDDDDEVRDAGRRLLGAGARDERDERNRYRERRQPTKLRLQASPSAPRRAL